MSVQHHRDPGMPLTGYAIAASLLSARAGLSPWHPIATAPTGVSLLVRCGATLCFAGHVNGFWRRDDGRVVHPTHWVEP